MKHGIPLSALLVAVACTAACGGSTRPGSLRAAPGLPSLAVYRQDVQQGNIVTPAMLAGLQPGMTQERVRQVMGSPQLLDPFHPDRWDYLYSQRHGYQLREQRMITIYFDGERLDRVEGDVVPQPGARYRQLLAGNQRTNISVPPAPPAPKNLAERVGRGLGLVKTPPPPGYDLESHVDTDEPGAYARTEGAADKEPQTLGPGPAGPTFVPGAKPDEKSADQAATDAPDNKTAQGKEPGLFDGLLDRIGL